MARNASYLLNSPAQLRALLIGFRKEQKLTQAALAEKLGITQQSYAQIEANPAVASFERLYRILRLLDVQITLGKPVHGPCADQPAGLHAAEPVQAYAGARQDEPAPAPGHEQDDW